MRTNESTYIPAGHKHRLENPGKLDLVMIEVRAAATWERTVSCGLKIVTDASERRREPGMTTRRLRMFHVWHGLQTLPGHPALLSRLDANRSAAAVARSSDAVVLPVPSHIARQYLARAECWAQSQPPGAGPRCPRKWLAHRRAASATDSSPLCAESLLQHLDECCELDRPVVADVVQPIGRVARRRDPAASCPRWGGAAAPHRECGPPLPRYRPRR